MEPQKLQILASDNLRFIGEGNEHIVFSIANSDNVLRFRKVHPGDVISREEFMLRVENDIRFTNGIVKLLAGPLLTDEAAFIYVEPSLLKKVMKEIKELRDVKRLDKTINRFGLGIMTPNGAKEFVSRISHRSIHGLAILTAFQHTQTSFTLNKSFIQIHVRKYRSEDLRSTKTPKGAHPSINSQSKKISQLNLQESSPNGFCNCSSGSSEKTRSNHERNCPKFNPVSGVLKDTSHLVQQISEATKSMQQGSDNKERRSKQIVSVGGGKPKKICIELKPKQGFLEPFSGGSLCRFCLKQYIKVKEEIETLRSSYCPQDLYSGDLTLMKKALRCLFASPQNNLKIFSDGKAVPVSRYEEYCYLSDLIIQVLTHNLETPPHSFAAHSDNRGVIFENDKETLESQNQKSSPKQRNLESLSESSDTETTDKPVNDSTSSAEDVPEEQCDVVDKFSLPLYSYIPANSLLPSSSILGRILQMQSLGKISGLQAAIFFKELSKRFKSKEALYQRIADFQTFSETLPLNNFVKDKDGDYSVQLFVSDHTGEEFLSIRNEIDSLSTPNLIELLQQALIAMTFKDLSLMILMEGPFEFTPLLMIRQSPFWLEQPPGSDHWYKCQVSFIDMALKCPSKILEHESSLNKLQEVLCCLQENSSQPFCCKPKTEKRKL